MLPQPDTIPCEEASRLMPLYWSGEIEAPARVAFDAHLDRCPACWREADTQRRMDAELRRAVLAETISTSTAIARFQSAALPRPVWARWGVAAAVLIGAAAAGLGYRQIASDTVGDVYTAALSDHHRELIERQPRRWLNDLASVEKLAGEQGLAARVLAQLAPAGYRLEHGKLCRLDGRAYLHLVYRNQGEEVSLFLRGGDLPAPASSAELRDGKFLYAAGNGGEHLASVQTNSLSVLYVAGEAAEANRLAAQAAAVI